MRIGEVAALAGVNIDTVRYYERRSILPRPVREPSSGYRTYPQDTVRRIRFVRRAQDLGFTLKEIKDLLSLRARPGAKCADILARAEAKIRSVDDKIRTLRSMRRALSRLASECTGRGEVSECPILDALEDDKPLP